MVAIVSPSCVKTVAMTDSSSVSQESESIQAMEVTNVTNSQDVIKNLLLWD